ncbi:hypothetical protein FF041_16450 [Streptomyces jumonjinensis]|uniref:Uncharacterized protein n=1 Tax=Streptomyces jumonjinensis TaxID=1945 RepID=A0A646KI48_STRJU|nr:hypothetical protein [Streptomyces jumonjinensis]
MPRRRLRDAALRERRVHPRFNDDAHSPARALTWRVQRLGHRHTPSPRADAARIRSTTHRPSVVTPTHPAAVTPPPQATPTRRR